MREREDEPGNNKDVSVSGGYVCRREGLLVCTASLSPTISRALSAFSFRFRPPFCTVQPANRDADSGAPVNAFSVPRNYRHRRLYSLASLVVSRRHVLLSHMYINTQSYFALQYFFVYLYLFKLLYILLV